MISKVILAKLSPTMEDGTIVKWLKSEGDPVKIGDVLAEIETDKANMEMEAMGAGVLRKILVPTGGKAPVGSLIGVIAEADEDISALLQEPSPPAAAVAASVSAAPAAPSAASGPAAAPAAAPERVKASPLARAIAKAQNIPLPAIPGSGPAGRVIKRDVEAFQRAGGTGAPYPPAPRTAGEVPLTSMRKTIARRLSESFFTAPHFFVTVEIDMEAAAALRSQLEQAEGVKLSFNDLVVKACARALADFPLVNARWGEDKILTLAEIHIGVAVALPDGLITPVIRHADRKAILEIAKETKDLATRARDRKLRPDEYTGSTFTVSNLGMFGVTAFTAIINPPESAILAVGAVRRVPVVDHDSVRPGQRMNVTMSCDHRVVDGALAARFLERVRVLLEAPAALLLP